MTLAIVDIIVSGLTVGFWIDKTYHYGVRRWIEDVECVTLGARALLAR